MEAAGSEKLLPLRPWVGVTIGGRRLLAKSCFTDAAYSVLLSDLHGVWEESMDAAAVQTRAQSLNRRLQAPGHALLSHLCALVQPVLSGRRTGADCELVLQQDEPDRSATLTLRSELAGLPFHWEFHCSPAPSSLVCVELVRPLLTMSRLLQQHVEQLRGLLLKKDAQILDYQEGGATLSRERLRTDVFDEQANSDDLLSKVLPPLCADQLDARGFDAGLQRLYALVVSHGKARKRKLSDQCRVMDAGVAKEAEATIEEERDAVTKSNETVAIAAVNQESDAAPVVSGTEPVCSEVDHTTATQQRAQSSKPRKKKVGLFR